MSEGGGWRIVHHARVGSTQAEARALLAREGPLHRVAVSADVQETGVGRRGRSFASPAGGAWQTLVIAERPDRPVPDGRLSVAVAVAVADALAEHGRPVRTKWPNDLYRHERKCGGILIERARGHLFVGIGLNARNEPPAGFARLDLAADGVRALVREAMDRVLGGAYDDPRPAWDRHDLLRGRTVRVGRVRGRAWGLADDGGLRLVDAEGMPTIVRSGSVEAIDPPLRTSGDGR